MNKFRYNSKPVYKNIKKVWEQATDEEKEEGKLWYPKAHEYAEKFAKEYKVPLYVSSGIIAVMSPQKGWYQNLAISEEFLKTNGGVSKHTGTQTLKAKRILGMSRIQPEPLKWVDFILKGLKTVNFFHNIYDPYCKDYVTIDDHMLKLMTGDEGRSNITVNQYVFLKGCVQQFADKEGTHPVTTQAVLWLTWRRLKKERKKIESWYFEVPVE